MEEQEFEEVEHTADWALRIRGEDLEGLFTNAAAGMLHLAGIEPRAGPTRKRRFELQASDSESLLVTWLEELLFVIEMEEVTFTKFDLTVEDNNRLMAEVQESPIGNIKKHIKAVTYHNLKIKEVKDRLEVTVVFDV
jgi:SHS2 domain-containing protein